MALRFPERYANGNIRDSCGGDGEGRRALVVVRRMGDEANRGVITQKLVFFHLTTGVALWLYHVSGPADSCGGRCPRLLH